MKNYIVFLKGINVAGKNLVKMPALKTALTNNNLLEIKTYIQSGNILISNSNLDVNTIKEKIEKILREDLKIDTVSFVYSVEEIQTIINEIPFPIKDTKQLYFSFLSEIPSKEKQDLLLKKDYKHDAFQISKKHIYICCINGYGKTKLNNNFFEKNLRLKATTRNWNTVNRMITLAGEQNITSPH